MNYCFRLNWTKIKWFLFVLYICDFSVVLFTNKETTEKKINTKLTDLCNNDCMGEWNKLLVLWNHFDINEDWLRGWGCVFLLFCSCVLMMEEVKVVFHLKVHEIRIKILNYFSDGWFKDVITKVSLFARK